MKKIIIAAKSDNNVIGANNDLLWHLPADLEYFYRTIEGKYVLSGRKSFESAQGSDTFPFTKYSLILSKNKNYQANNAKVVDSLETAFQWAREKGAKELYILGGGTIYEQTLSLADKLMITEVHIKIKGSVYFPKIDKKKWKEINRRDFEKDENNPYSYSFVEYIKNRAHL